MSNLAEIFYEKYVIIRAPDSGVHFGILKEVDLHNICVLLENSRRIYYWEGAFTLTELSENGILDSSKLSIEKPLLLVLGVIEIIPCSEKAIEILKNIKSFQIE